MSAFPGNPYGSVFQIMLPVGEPNEYVVMSNQLKVLAEATALRRPRAKLLWLTS